MPLDVKDAARLWDMLDAARAAAMEFTASWRFITDRKMRDPVERKF